MRMSKTRFFCWFFSVVVAMSVIIPVQADSRSEVGNCSSFSYIAADRIRLNQLISQFSDYSMVTEVGYSSMAPGFARRTEINDSIEGCNRVIFFGNDLFLLWVLRPIMKGYFCIVPKSGREGINNVAVNVEFPARSLSCLLQGRPYDASIVLWRFLINTVAGGAGCYDIAEKNFGIRKRDEDMGQAFASWGIGPGCYLYLPVLGPSSTRDAVGLIFDYALDPKTYAPVPGIQSFAAFNKAALRLDDYVKLVNTFEDPYRILKTIWFIKRNVKIYVDR